MAEGRNVLLGILAILLGLIVIAFPLISVFVLSSIVGIGLIFIGVWLLAQSFDIWSSSKGVSIVALILGILGIIVGIGLFGKILAFSILVGLIIYIGGLFLIISGIIHLVSGQGNAGRWGGIIRYNTWYTLHNSRIICTEPIVSGLYYWIMAYINWIIHDNYSSTASSKNRRIKL